MILKRSVKMTRSSVAVRLEVISIPASEQARLRFLRHAAQGSGVVWVCQNAYDVDAPVVAEFMPEMDLIHIDHGGGNRRVERLVHADDAPVRFVVAYSNRDHAIELELGFVQQQRVGHNHCVAVALFKPTTGNNIRL